MLRLSVSICLIAVGLSTSLRAEEPLGEPAGKAARHTPAAKIAWRFDLAGARDEALKLNKPMLLVIGAPWCQYSRKLDSQTLSDPQVLKVVEEHFVPVLLSFDRSREIARKLEVKSLPCTIILSPEADLLGRLVGHVEAQQYHDALLASRRLQDRVQQVRYQGQK